MRRHAAGVLLAAVFLAAGFSLLRDYGVNWDEALGDLFFGERYLSFLTSFDTRYLDFAHDPYPAGHQPDLRMSPFRTMPEQYYPFANILGMATSRVLAPLLDPFDGFHAVNLLFGAIFIICFVGFLQRHYSTPVACVAVALLFTSPRICYDAMCNVKDFPEMVLFALAAMAYFEAWERGTFGWYVGAGALWGASLATKANALFLVPVVLAFALLTRRGAVAKLVAAAFTGVMVMIAVWPWLWGDPWTRLRENLSYIAIRTMETSPEVTTSAPLMLLLTTPPLFLLLIVSGIALAAARARRGVKVDLFFLIYIAVVLARISLPGAANFDGVRHFLELFPPLAAIAAASLLTVEWRRAAAIGAIALVPGIAGIVRMHPFENAYWNVLAGGTAGAHARHLPQAGEYWATSYRQGIDWLNRNAPPHAAVVVPIAEQTLTLVAPVRMRRDLELVAYDPPGRRPDPNRLPKLAARAARQQVYVMFIRRDENGNELTRACIGGLKPVAEWSRDGVPLMQIYSLAGVGYKASP